MPRKMLILCMGNICRSPMAQVVLQRDLGEVWLVESAGLNAMVGHGAAPNAIAALRGIGLDAPNHSARQVTAEILRDSEIILVMELRQKIELEELFPWIRGRIFRLGHWEKIEIDDPYRRPQEVFEHTLMKIETCARTWLPHLKLITHV